MKAKPCPKCKNADLEVADCGYSSFNVAWVKCKKCKLTVKLNCADSAVSEWNQWAKNPIGTLVKQIRYDKKEKRRHRSSSGHKDTEIDVSEYAADLIDTMQIINNTKQKWQDFDYCEWLKKDKKFDHAKFDKETKEMFDNAKTIDDLLNLPKQYARPPFKPNSYYDSETDILHVHLEDSGSYNQQITPQLTLALDLNTKEIIGFQIWGLSRIPGIGKIISEDTIEDSDTENKNERET